MRTAAIIISMMMAAFASASGAAAQSATIDPVETPRMFRDAAFGYCAERVHSQAMVTHAIDPAKDGWVDLQNPQTTGGQRIFAGRLNTSTGVIVDVSPSGTSCFVQMNLGTSSLETVAGLRSEVAGWPHAVLLDEVDNELGHGTVYGLIDPASDMVRIFSINDSGPQGSAATIIVARGSKGN